MGAAGDDEQAVFFIFDEFGDAANLGRNHCKFLGHCFHKHNRDAFHETGDDHDIGAVDVLLDFVLADGTCERDSGLDSEVPNQISKIFRERPVAHHVEMPIDAGFTELAACLKYDGVALDGFESADGDDL